jgi:hypothetical protein
VPPSYSVQNRPATALSKPSDEMSRKTGDPVWEVLQASVGRREQVAVGYLDALGPPGGARGVDDVGEVVRMRPPRRRVPRAGRSIRRRLVDADHRDAASGDRCVQRSIGDHNRRGGVVQDELGAPRRDVRVQRHVSGAGGQRGEHRDHRVR